MSAELKVGRMRPLVCAAVLRSQTDARLAALAGQGNQPAFAAIVDRYERELRSHAMRIVRVDRAEDVVQQAMLAAWTALLAGSDVTDLRPWLHRIVHNAAVDTVQRRGYEDSEIPATSIAPDLTDELAERRLSAAEAIAAIAALPASQRRALTMTAIEGRSGRDAALAMGISESAMRQLVHRAPCGVRSAVTAFVPLPLVTWLASAGGATSGAVGLGAAGGVIATSTKVVAALALAGAALGTTHELAVQKHAGRPRPARPLITVNPSTVQAARSDTARSTTRAALVSAQLRQSVEAADTNTGSGPQGQNDPRRETPLGAGNDSGQSSSGHGSRGSAGGASGKQQQGLLGTVSKPAGQAGAVGSSPHQSGGSDGGKRQDTRQQPSGRNQS